MSGSKLVQLGSDLYLLPEDVVKIYTTEPLKIEGLIDSPGETYVVSRTYGFMGPQDVYRTSDWPIEKIRAALGLTDVDALERMLQGDES